MLDEALFNAVNVLARPPELVLEVVESSVSAMVLVFWIYGNGGRGAEKGPYACSCVPIVGTLLSCLASQAFSLEVNIAGLGLG